MISDRTIDRFWLDLEIHHPHCDPTVITEALHVEPSLKLKTGQQLGTILQKSTFWLARFRSGSAGEEFVQALEDFLAFLTTHSEYLKTLIAEEGDVTLSLNHTAIWDDGVISDLRLEPCFIQTLGDYCVGLKFKVWSAAETLPITRKL